MDNWRGVHPPRWSWVDRFVTWPFPSDHTGRPKGLLRGSSQHAVVITKGTSCGYLFLAVLLLTSLNIYIYIYVYIICRFI